MKAKKYYALSTEGRRAELSIFGDITSFPWLDSDVSAFSLSKALSELDDVDEIDVDINSYGGEVAEGLAIYNALRRHKARVVTRCEGFACSVASVVFMAGDERIMREASLLMIHNAWAAAEGNAAQLRKQADDLDTITQASKTAYLERVGIGEAELSALMDAETWITPEDAVEMGFATSVEGGNPADKAAQSARKAVFARMTATEPDKDETDPENGSETPEKDDDEPKADKGGGEEPDKDGEGGQEPGKGAPAPDDGDGAGDPGEDPDDEPEKKEQGGACAALAAFLAARF